MNGSVLCIISIIATVLSKLYAKKLFWFFLITTIIQVWSWGIMHNFTYTKEDYDNMPKFIIAINLISSIAAIVLYIIFVVYIIIKLI